MGFNLGFKGLTLENAALRSFEKSVTAHLSTKTRIQEAMNPQKHCCGNLKCSKCLTTVRKERKPLVARRRNKKESCVNFDTREVK